MAYTLPSGVSMIRDLGSMELAYNKTFTTSGIAYIILKSPPTLLKVIAFKGNSEPALKTRYTPRFT